MAANDIMYFEGDTVLLTSLGYKNTTGKIRAVSFDGYYTVSQDVVTGGGAPPGSGTLVRSPLQTLILPV